MENSGKSEKIKYDDFAKLDLRVGKILAVEEHPNAGKLFVLKVDLGEKDENGVQIERTIVAGLKEYYKKEELEGKKAIFVANLEPAKLRGIESNGMILAAVNDDRKNVVFLKPEKDIKLGTKIS